MTVVAKLNWTLVTFSLSYLQSESEADDDSKGEGHHSRTPSESSEKGERPQSRDGQKYSQVRHFVGIYYMETVVFREH